MGTIALSIIRTRQRLVEMNCASDLPSSENARNRLKQSDIAFDNHGDDLIVSGAGSPVVLLHCSLSTKRQWLPLMSQLSRKHQCIAIDLLGYGDAPSIDHERWCSTFSLGDEAQHVRKRLGDLFQNRVEAVHLVGHSYGGAVALKLAQESTLPIRSLALYEPVSFHLLPKSHSAFVSIDSLASTITSAVRTAISTPFRDGDLLIERLRSSAKLFVDFWGGEGTFDRVGDSAQRRMSELMPKVALDFQALLNDEDRLSGLSSFWAPTLLVGGRLSPKCMEKMLYILEAVLPQVELQWVPSSHMAPVTDPVRVNPLVASFIAQVESTTAA